MMWAPNTLNLPQWDKLTRSTLGWVGVQCERQSLNHPTPRPQAQPYTSHQSFGTPLKPIGHYTAFAEILDGISSNPHHEACCAMVPPFGGFGSSVAPTYARGPIPMASSTIICIQANIQNTKTHHAAAALSWYDLGANDTQFASLGQTNKVHLGLGWGAVCVSSSFCAS